MAAESDFVAVDRGPHRRDTAATAGRRRARENALSRLMDIGFYPLLLAGVVVILVSADCHAEFNANDHVADHLGITSR